MNVMDYKLTEQQYADLKHAQTLGVIKYGAYLLAPSDRVLSGALNADLVDFIRNQQFKGE